ncbi:hypothetical protein E2542_SST30770 [Spatholobus suberectus]|nr:hypothetical protein E2542_SST30770 [Spatholobus suberectus]
MIFRFNVSMTKSQVRKSWSGREAQLAYERKKLLAKLRVKAENVADSRTSSFARSLLDTDLVARSLAHGHEPLRSRRPRAFSLSGNVTYTKKQKRRDKFKGEHVGKASKKIVAWKQIQIRY